MATVAITHIEIRDGEPVIAGTRITVHDIATMYVLNATPLEGIVANFPVTPAQVYAALAYYYDHKLQIDAEIAANDALARRAGLSAVPIVERIRARMEQRSGA